MTQPRHCDWRQYGCTTLRLNWHHLAEAHAGAAELRLDMGRRALMNSPAGSAEAVAALELLQRSVQGFRASAQLDPEQRGVYIYNTVRAYALLGNNAACMEARRAKGTERGGFARQYGRR